MVPKIAIKTCGRGAVRWGQRGSARLDWTVLSSSRDVSARDLFLDAEQKILGMTILSRVFGPPNVEKHGGQAQLQLFDFKMGREGFEPSKGVARQIYSLVHLTALPPTRKNVSKGTELYQISAVAASWSKEKCRNSNLRIGTFKLGL